MVPGDDGKLPSAARPDQAEIDAQAAEADAWAEKAMVELRELAKQMPEQSPAERLARIRAEIARLSAGDEVKP